MRSTTETRYAEAATFLRTALLLGLLKPEDAIAWADEIVRHDPAPASSVLTLAITTPELSTVREVLRPLAFASEPSSVIDAVLGLAARDLARGRRGVDDTLQVFSQCRAFLKLEPRLADEIALLQMQHMVARSGDDAARLEQLRARVVELASRFLEIPPVVDVGAG